MLIGLDLLVHRADADPGSYCYQSKLRLLLSPHISHWPEQTFPSVERGPPRSDLDVGNYLFFQLPLRLWGTSYGLLDNSAFGERKLHQYRRITQCIWNFRRRLGCIYHLIPGAMGKCAKIWTKEHYTTNLLIALGYAIANENAT